MKPGLHQLYEYGAAIMVAAAAGLVGSFALLKRMSLASDVVSHLALPGIGIALVFRFNPMLGAAATLFVGTILVWGLEKKTGMATEAVIGVVFAAALAAGALITPREELSEALFGQLQPLTFSGFLIASAAALAIITYVLWRKHHLVLALFSRDVAAASGVPIDRLNLEFLLLFSLTILLCLKFLGALLSGALLMIPAATGRRLAQGTGDFLKYAVASSIMAVVIGLLVSSIMPGIPTAGPAIVLAAAATFILVSFVGRR
jgi:ABC-type Mn2+/Zn2+ transport system permease subunit